jgi:small subunit ribosomal protein S6
MREYELMFVVDPRLTDDEIVGLSDQYKAMIESAGGDVYKEESWGKRKLAYQINKLSEGSYMLFHVRGDGGDVFTEVEQRMRQNERILRYLTVRTNSGRLRLPETVDESEESETAPDAPAVDSAVEVAEVESP